MDDGMGKAVELIQESARNERVTEVVGSITYIKKGMEPAIFEPEIAFLSAVTLQAVVDFIRSGVDELGKIMLYVTERRVLVLSAVQGMQRRRTVWLNCHVEEDEFEFDNYLSPETFNIQAQTRIVDGGDRAAILKAAGTVKAERIKTHEDDGVKQTVQTRAGVVLGEGFTLPNPVTLRPYRTFREIEQPESLFSFRAHQDEPDEMPGLGLFEADGGAWKLEAVKRIKARLREWLPEIPIIG